MTTTTAAVAPEIQSLKTGHVGLSVTDIARSHTFYKQVLGLETLGEGGEGDRSYVFLGREGQLLLTLWQQSTDAFSAAHAGLHHLSFQVETIEEVTSVEATLRDLSAELVYDGVVPHGEGMSSGGIFFADPDGTRLEVYAPTGADTAAAPTAGAPTCGFF